MYLGPNFLENLEKLLSGFIYIFILVKKTAISCLTCVRPILRNVEFRSDSHFECPECQILVPIPHRYELNRFAEFGGASGVLHGCRNLHRGFWAKSDMSDSHMRYFCSEGCQIKKLSICLQYHRF